MITLGTIESILIIVLGFVLVVILLQILLVVHRQTRRVKDLEMRMKAVEGIDAEQISKD